MRLPRGGIVDWKVQRKGFSSLVVLCNRVRLGVIRNEALWASDIFQTHIEWRMKRARVQNQKG